VHNSTPTSYALLISQGRPARSVSVALLGCVATMLAASCANNPTPDKTELGTVTQAIGGIEGTFEYALDAPWRMNPRLVPADRTSGGSSGGGLVRAYDAVPIQISIHDADRTGDEHGSPNAAQYDWTSTAAEYAQAGIQRRPSRLADVCSLTIVDGARETEVPIADFDEVERSYAWTFPSTAAGPARDVCARSSKGNCATLAGVGDTSEWYGLVNYQPLRVGNSAEDVRLELRLKVKRPGPTTCASPFASHFVKLVNQVKIHYGEAPLPRFSSQWVYGDLHYHSQGTDNEGESGHNYRGVTRAMGAIGLDYLWATEHASSSEQFMDVDAQFGSTGYDNLSVYAQRGVLRDMDRNRFAAMRQAVAETNVASAARGGGPNRTPQIFLGGEVDVIPEIPGSYTGPYRSVPYGAKKVFDIDQLCGGWKENLHNCTNSSDGVRTCDGDKFDKHPCNTNNLYEQAPSPFGGGPDSYLVRDHQGVNEFFYGREHMVYLPEPMEADQFVASMTSRYGGARRRLRVDRAEGSEVLPGVLPEVERKRGSVFLAHHNNAPGGSSGPDGVPWSAQTRRARA
jgi:hypothetical protein